MIEEPTLQAQVRSTPINRVWRTIYTLLLQHPRRYLIVFGVLMAFLLSTSIDRLAASWALSELDKAGARQGVNVSAASISLRLLRLTPVVEIHKLQLGQPGAEMLLENADVIVRFRWWDLMADTTLVKSLILSSGRVNLLIDSEGNNNWDGLLTAMSSSDSANENSGATFEALQIRDLLLEYINDENAQTGSVNANVDWVMSGDVSDSSVTIYGDVNLLPISIDASSHTSMSAELGTQISSASFLAKLADTSLTIEATTDDLSSLENGEVHINLDGRSVSDTLRRLSLGITGVSSLNLEGVARYHSDDVLSGSFDLSLDRSHARAIVALDGLRGTRLNERRRLSGSLSFTDLYMDKVLGHTNADRSVVRDSETTANVKDKQKLLSDDALAYPQFIADLDIDFKLDVERFYSGSLLVKNMEAALSKKANKLLLDLQSNDFGEGELKLSLSLDSEDQQAQGKFSARAKQVPVDDILSAGDLAEGLVSGKISGDAKFWFVGNSIAQALGTLDGGLFVLLEDGKLDSLMVELAGADLMESIGLVFTDDLQQSEVRCGFVDIQVISGLMSLNDFIIDTEDSVFIASGDVNLSTEELDLKFSPHPRDTSFFAATTPVHITGSLANPKFRPGSKLYTRVALAAAMVALASPAAAILPFIELGGGAEQSYCKELFDR
ncbi:MAG: AsmA-like C-terminal region-containing protein [Granulosicoccus sp.]